MALEKPVFAGPVRVAVKKRQKIAKEALFFAFFCYSKSITPDLRSLLGRCKSDVMSQAFRLCKTGNPADCLVTHQPKAVVVQP